MTPQDKKKALLAAWPTLTVGPEALGSAGSRWKNFAVVTTRSPWKAAEQRLPRPAQLIFVADLERTNLNAFASRLRDLELIVGIGSGLPMDAAKFLAKAAQIKLVQVPTTSSNNACFTRTAWTFEKGLRIPEREIPIPEQVILDTQLLAQAPSRMNRAGAAEILCSHTALFDWKLAAEAGLDVEWDDDLARFTRAELKALDEFAPSIGANQIDAFVEILQVGAKFAKGFTTHPKARFNSGSEHIFAWGLEEKSGKRLIHGDAVSLGILLMSYIQKNKPEVAAATIRAARMSFMPEEIGVTWKVVEATMADMPRYAACVPWHTVINRFTALGKSGLDELLDHFTAAKRFVQGLI